MGARIGYEVASGPAASAEGAQLSPWEAAAGRVAEYLRALGVQNPLHIELLSTRIRQRLDARANTAALEDPVEAGIEETYALVDAWLIAELGIEGDRDALFAARAAVLSGVVPGWVDRFAGVSGQSLAGPIRAASVQATPEPAPLAMEPNSIELCCHHWGHRLLNALRRLLGPEQVGGPVADRPHLGRP